MQRNWAWPVTVGPAITLTQVTATPESCGVHCDRHIAPPTVEFMSKANCEKSGLELLFLAVGLGFSELRG